ncbi:ABC transporter permease [Nocardioides alpinus]|nr:ABC transporter permease [Nocardioides alpinus]
MEGTSFVADPDPPSRARGHARIPLRRIAVVELRKSFDTRAGRWLLASVGILSFLTTAAVIAFSPDDDFTFSTFTTTIAFPMSVVLPIIAALAVTAEWTQRSGLTTFTIVPHRGRIMQGKAVALVAVSVPATALAFAVGACGNVVASWISGQDAVWDQSVSAVPYLLLSLALSLAVGLACGTLIRSSAGAVVGFFVFSFVFPPLLGLLAVTQGWFRDVQPWVDLDFQLAALLQGSFGSEQWSQLATSTGLWLVLPLTVGLVTLLRSEVK